MEFSPTRQSQVAACEKLRDTVTGISALYKSLHEMNERSLSPMNSFTELYRTSTQAMIKRKEEMTKHVPKSPFSRPSGIVVSDADCSTVGSGFASRVRHGCLCCNPSLLCDVCFTLTSMVWVRISKKAWVCVCKCIVPVRHQGMLNIRRAASSLERLVGDFLTLPRVFSLEIGVELNQNVPSPAAWCLKLWLKKEFRGPRSDTIDRVTLEKTARTSRGRSLEYLRRTIKMHERPVGNGPCNFEPWSSDEAGKFEAGQSVTKVAAAMSVPRNNIS
ncbi:hypothetical protein TNCV_1132221 [Trichonephila clavipes]|nr:hypothetical protein TNCV_1132221 [Trichonephila clavipes]